MLRKRTTFAASRRALLLGGAAFAAWAYLPKFARAADGRDPRLIVVILRGALDGLATVAPIGDPDYAGLHGSIALTPDGPHAAAPLDSFFALHPSMPEFARMYRDKTGRRRFTPSRRPIATARISTDRMCSKAAMPGRAACNRAGSTARSRRCRGASG